MTFQLPIKISHSKLLKTYWELKRQAYASGGKYDKTVSGTELFTARKGRWIFSDEYLEIISFMELNRWELISEELLKGIKKFQLLA